MYDLILFSRMYSATFINLTRLVLTFERDISVPFDESESLSSPDFRVALLFALLAFVKALILEEPISLKNRFFLTIVTYII